MPRSAPVGRCHRCVAWGTGASDIASTAPRFLDRHRLVVVKQLSDAPRHAAARQLFRRFESAEGLDQPLGPAPVLRQVTVADESGVHGFRLSALPHRLHRCIVGNEVSTTLARGCRCGDASQAGLWQGGSAERVTRQCKHASIPAVRPIFLTRFRGCVEIEILKWSESLPIGRSVPPPPLAGVGRGGAKPHAQRLWPGPLPSPSPQAGEGTRSDKRECRILHTHFRGR
jgi:hypothetical protein